MAEQTLTLPAHHYAEGSAAVLWQNLGSPDTELDSAFVPVDDTVYPRRQLNIVRLDRISGQAGLEFIALESDGTASPASADLTDAFEATGGFEITHATVGSLTVELAGADMTEPYIWIPSNSAEVIAFANAVFALSGNQSATLRLFDGAPLLLSGSASAGRPSATASLSLVRFARPLSAEARAGLPTARASLNRIAFRRSVRASATTGLPTASARLTAPDGTPLPHAPAPPGTSGQKGERTLGPPGAPGGPGAPGPPGPPDPNPDPAPVPVPDPIPGPPIPGPPVPGPGPDVPGPPNPVPNPIPGPPEQVDVNILVPVLVPVPGPPNPVPGPDVPGPPNPVPGPDVPGPPNPVPNPIPGPPEQVDVNILVPNPDPIPNPVPNPEPCPEPSPGD